jgi:TolB protein
MNAGSDATPSLSPDGKRVLFVSTRDDPEGEIYVMNVDGTGVTRLTFAAGYDETPVWSKDGKEIAFSSTRDAANPTSEYGRYENDEIYTMNADGSGVTRLTYNAQTDLSPTWSSDGKRIAFASDRDATGGGTSIYSMNADGTGVTRLTYSPGYDGGPAWSPGGKQIAFTRQNHVFVMNADGTQLTQLTWSGINADPAWLDGAKRIAFVSYRDANNDIYAMNADGTAVTRLTTHPALDAWPSGQR